MTARILMLMGSGETSPTMVKAHREVFSQLDKGATAVILDTPIGFQANADDIVQRAQDYFRVSVGVKLDLASLRDVENTSVLDRETFANAVKGASYVFAGPGSPTYALRQWAQTNTSALLEEKLVKGGVVAFSSAAVSTLGRFTVPVYEIYKAGEAVELRTGLNVIGIIGLDALVIPHFNNAEGGNHDTRFCYMGESRLSTLESQLPPETVVLGLDEHTGLVIDLENDKVEVVGIGHVTVRKGAASELLPAGTRTSLDNLRSLLSEIASGHTNQASKGHPANIQYNATEVADDNLRLTPLLQNIESYLEKFDSAFRQRNSQDCLAIILELDSELVAWSADTLQSDEIDKGRAATRSMIARLEPVLRAGFITDRERLGPMIDTLLELRASSRLEKRWSDADLLRDRLDGLGVVVKDTPSGVEWSFSDGR